MKPTIAALLFAGVLVRPAAACGLQGSWSFGLAILGAPVALVTILLFLLSRIVRVSGRSSAGLRRTRTGWQKIGQATAPRRPGLRMVPAGPIAETARCPVCTSPLGGLVVACSDCGVPHHRECLVYNGGCAIYGCRRLARSI